MRTTWMLTIGWMLLTAAVWAEAPAEKPAETPAAPAQEAPAPTPAPDAQQLQSTFDQPIDRSVKEQISVDLIDLDVLRQAVEAKVTGEVVRMTLDECIQLALKQNSDVILAKIGPQKSDADILTAKGEFDPAWQTTGLYNRSRLSTSQDIKLFGQGISEVKDYRTTLDSAVAGKLKTGTKYQLAFDMVKDESTYGKFIADFSTKLGLTLTQPLLRGMSWRANTARIEMARNGRKLSEAQLRMQIMDTISKTIKGYWDLVGAMENVKVRETALTNAERLLEICKKQLEIGTAADLAVLQAKAGVATRQSDLITARTQVASASDALKLLLNMREAERFSTADIVPTDRPNPEDKSLMNPADFERHLEESTGLALKNRPEVELVRLQIENAKLDEFRTKQDMMPQFDLNGQYLQGGRDHYLARTFYAGMFNGKDKVYSYGFQATVPLGNRAARGANLRAKLTRREAEERSKQTDQGLQLNVRMALRNMMTSQFLVESNRQAMGLQQANVVAEEKKLRLGTTTSWQVLKVQEDLTAAQTMELQSRIAYEKSVVDLQLSEGTLLDHIGVEVEAPEGARADSYVVSILPKTPW